MLNNMKIAPRLILIGGLLILIPLIIVGVIAINRASSGLTFEMDAQLGARSKSVSNLVNQILHEELKLVSTIAVSTDVITAAKAISERGKDRSSREIEAVTDYISRISGIEAVRKQAQVIAIVSMDGVLVAANEDRYVGVDVNDRDYFRAAKSGKMIIGKASLNKVTQKPFISIAAPIKDGGRTIGVMMYLYDIGLLTSITSSETIGKTGYSYIIDETGLVVAHPNPDHILKTNLGELPGMETFIAKMKAGESGVDKYYFEGIDKAAGYAPIGSTGMSLGLTMPESEYLETVSQMRVFIIIVGVLAVAGAIIVFFFFALSLSKNLNKGVEFARKIAHGDLNATIDIDQKDEIGQLANALKSMADELRTAIMDINDVMAEVRSGNLTKGVTANLTGDMSQLKVSINDSIAMLSDTIVQVINSSREVKTGSIELSSSAQNLASGTTEQAASLEEIASSMGEVGAKTKLNDENATQSKQLIHQTLQVVREGNQQMEAMSTSIMDINETSMNVTKIIKEINDIAFQTNLLALNAAVEAARAGQYGKGFAVVAEEVRNLAVRSAEAAKNSEELITNSTRQTEKGVENAQKTSEALEAINDSIQKVNDIIEEIAASSNEQRMGFEEINKGLSQVNDVIQNNSSISEETASASDELSAQAVNLEDLMSRFSVKGAQRMNTPAMREVTDEDEFAAPAHNIGYEPQTNGRRQITL